MGMGAIGSSHSSQDHKEPFRAAGDDWGSAQWSSTSLCTASSTSTWLWLCFVLAAESWMCQPLSSSGRDERDFF